MVEPPSSEPKVVIITGASRGIGAHLVKGFRAIGYRVVATSRSIGTSDVAADPAVLAIDGDIASPDTAERVVGAAIERYGRIDTLVNNAGIFIPKPFVDYSQADFAAATAANLAGFFHISQRAASRMLQAGSGHIVNITAAISEQPAASLPSALAALTKGGLNAVTRALAIEYAKQGIRVNAVSPGVIETPMHAPAMHAFLAGLQPMGRMGAHAGRRRRRALSRTGAIRHRRDPARRRRRSRRPLVSAEMWPDRRLTDLLEIEHPLVLAPMAGFGTVELAAAVCAAGGLGSIGCGPVPPPAAAKTIAELRALTNKPINVNFFCHAPAKADAGRERSWLDRLSAYYRELGIDAEPPPTRVDLPPFGDDMCKVVEEPARTWWFPFRLASAGMLTRIKAAGCRVMASATTVAEARWLERAASMWSSPRATRPEGIAGCSSHPTSMPRSQSQSGAMALVPQIVDAVSIPVVAAGGIADGRGIAAAFALGACGTQIGTAYLLCPEAATPPLHRDALRQADADTTVLTNVFTGRPARVLPNRLPRELGPMTDAAPDFPLPLGATAPLRAKAEQQGDGEFTPLWSGQAATLAREMPAQALTLALANEAIARFKQMAG